MKQKLNFIMIPKANKERVVGEEPASRGWWSFRFEMCRMRLGRRENFSRQPGLRLRYAGRFWGRKPPFQLRRTVFPSRRSGGSGLLARAGPAPSEQSMRHHEHCD